MSGSVIKAAIQACEKRTVFRPRQELAQLLRDNNIGLWTGDRVQLNPLAREKLWDLLERLYGVPRGTTVEAWDGLDRSQALDLGTNEKNTDRAVRSNRIAIKAMPGQPLRLGDALLFLPNGGSIDWDASRISDLGGHDAILWVENWEAFEKFHDLNFEIPEKLSNAVLLYRGDVGAYPTAAAKFALETATQPVWVFSDPDPAGLMIALSAPRRAGLLWPSPQSLAEIFTAGRGDRARFSAQLPGVQHRLQTTDDAEIQSYWRVIEAAGRALPQEEFLRSARHN